MLIKKSLANKYVEQPARLVLELYLVHRVWDGAEASPTWVSGWRPL